MTPQMSGQGVGDRQPYGPNGAVDDHLWAMLAYVLGLIFSIIGPLIIFLVKMNESRYVRYHAAQALNMAITGLIYFFGLMIVSVILALIVHALAALAFLALTAYGLTALVFMIMAAIGAYRGDMYRVPTVLCLPLIH